MGRCFGVEFIDLYCIIALGTTSVFFLYGLPPFGVNHFSAFKHAHSFSENISSQHPPIHTDYLMPILPCSLEFLHGHCEIVTVCVCVCVVYHTYLCPCLTHPLIPTPTQC